MSTTKLSELAKLELIPVSEFYQVFIVRENEGYVKMGQPPSQRTTEPIPLKFGTHT